MLLPLYQNIGPGDILAPLGNFCPPWELYPEPILGQKNEPNPAKTFFFL